MMKKSFMAFLTVFVFLAVSMGAVSAANSTNFSNVNMINSGALNVNIDDPLALKGTLSFKGIQYDDSAAIKIKWTDSFPGTCGDYYVGLKINYFDQFGEIETVDEGFFVDNGTTSTSETVTIPYMDLSKVSSVTVIVDDCNRVHEEPYYHILK